MKYIFTILLLLLYTSLLAQQPQLYPIKKDGKWGYIDQEGNIKIEPKYDNGDIFRDGLARIEKAGKVGYINQQNEEVIPCQFKEGFGFHDGLACVQKARTWRLIDTTGSLVTDSQFLLPPYFVNGYAFVSRGSEDSSYFINKKGERVSFELSDCVQLSDDWEVMSQHGYWMLLNKSEKFLFMKVSKPFFCDAFQDGLAITQNLNKQYGCINTKGEVVIKPTYLYLSKFTQGLCIAHVDNQ